MYKNKYFLIIFFLLTLITSIYAYDTIQTANNITVDIYNTSQFMSFNVENDSIYFEGVVFLDYQLRDVDTNAIIYNNEIGTTNINLTTPNKHYALEYNNTHEAVVVEPITPAQQCNSTKSSSFVAFSLISLLLLVGIVVSVFLTNDMDLDTVIILVVSSIGMFVVLSIGYIIINIMSQATQVCT